VTAGHDGLVDDRAIAAALVTAEAALARAWSTVGIAPVSAASAVSAALAWRDAGEPCALADGELDELLAGMLRGSAAGGNPVIPLATLLRARVEGAAGAEAAAWVHRGATSQDVLDSALMLVVRRAGERVLGSLRALDAALAALAREHRDTVAVARTLTQHAVPTTLGLRASRWLRAVRRAAERLDVAVAQLPAQLGGAGGTLASFRELALRSPRPHGSAESARSGGDALSEAEARASAAGIAAALPAAFARELDLAPPAAPWHTERWPVTELGDAFAQTLDALGVIAADVATLSRTELGELAEGAGGGSSAMPQKRNPAASVLVRSAALRAPHLAATLHTASALAVDERPDGAWHAEWPTLRELARLALGASAHAAAMVAGLRVDREAIDRNVRLTRGLVVAERLSIALGPILGADRVKRLVADAGAGADLGELLRAEPGLEGIDVDALLDPAGYTGLAAPLVDAALSEPATESRAPDDPPADDSAQPLGRTT